jgi:hypothetical protein
MLNKSYYILASTLITASAKIAFLRKIAAAIDFDFIYNQVEDKYGTNGNISVPPPVILNMMLLLIFYNVRSERELIQTIPERQS